MTYDGTTLRLYLDGVEVNNMPLTGPVDVDPAIPAIVGGQSLASDPRYFDGLIDNVRIMERAMSADEMAAVSVPSPGPISNVLPVVMSSDTTITASFSQGSYSLTTNMIGGGTIQQSPEQPFYDFGDTVIVTPLPDAGCSTVH